jgi:hypothetical protein
VTSIIPYGRQITFEINLAGTADPLNNRYFIVFGNNASFQIPLPPPDNIDHELIEPGTLPFQGDIADYYTRYYNSWAGYIIVEPGGYFLARGPFVVGEPLTREALASLGEPGSKLKVTFDLEYIYGNSIPATIYFDALSVRWVDDQLKLPADHLNSTNAYISSISGSQTTVNDDLNETLPAGLNILNCTVKIE